MRAATVVKLIVALLVGVMAALATFDLVKNPVDCSKVACGRDSPGPLF
jgi:hypothetical protein